MMTIKTKRQADPLANCSTAFIYEASTMTIYEASSSPYRQELAHAADLDC